jgi:hypothetical protein
MFGSFLKGATQIVSAPLDIADIGLDVITGRCRSSISTSSCANTKRRW